MVGLCLLAAKVCRCRQRLHMRDRSGYDVRLLKTNGSRDCWPELEQQGKAFVVGTPGQGYTVSITAPKGCVA